MTQLPQAIHVTGYRAHIHGQLHIHGSKNGASKLLGAALLPAIPCELTNLPDILDTRILKGFLTSIGYELRHSQTTLRIKRGTQQKIEISQEFAAYSRSFLLLLVGLLHTHKEVHLYKPEGCQIGDRPIELYIKVLAAFGVRVASGKARYSFTVREYTACVFTLPLPSVVASSLAFMAASLAVGTSTIHGISLEPEVLTLVEVLQQMGTSITVNGRTATIVGSTSLKTCTIIVPPDRNVLFTYIIATLLTQGHATFTNCNDAHMRQDKALAIFLKNQRVPHTYSTRGLTIDGRNFIPRPMRITADWYPGFQTDWQPLVAPLLLRAVGSSSIEDRIFEDRLRYWDEFRKMGIASQSTAEVGTHATVVNLTGPQNSNAATVRALDIRAGAATVLLGLVSKGITTVMNVEQIARGYEDIVRDLQLLGMYIDYV